MSVLGWSLTLNGALMGLVVFVFLRTYYLVRADMRDAEAYRQERNPPKSCGCAFCDGGVPAFHDGLAQYHRSPDGKLKSPCRKYGVPVNIVPTNIKPYRRDDWSF